MWSLPGLVNDGEASEGFWTGILFFEQTQSDPCREAQS